MSNGAYNIFLRRIGTTQTVTTTNSSTTVTNPFSAQTYLIRLCSNTPCNFRVHEAALTVTVTVGDPFMNANFPDYFTVSPGMKVSTLRKENDGIITAANGTVWVTEFGS